MFNQDDINELLRQFPPIQFAVAYGSGVLKQIGYSNSDSAMIDIMFAVPNAKEWHGINMNINPSHYNSGLPLSNSDIAYLQDNTGGRIWYNTYVPINIKRFPNRLIKYGVITANNLVADLIEWKWLYVAGNKLCSVLYAISSTCN